MAAMEGENRRVRTNMKIYFVTTGREEPAFIEGGVEKILLSYYYLDPMLPPSKSVRPFTVDYGRRISCKSKSKK